MAREELGINRDELGGSAWVAAVMSFSLSVATAECGRSLNAHPRRLQLGCKPAAGRYMFV